MKEAVPCLAPSNITALDTARAWRTAMELLCAPELRVADLARRSRVDTVHWFCSCSVAALLAILPSLAKPHCDAFSHWPRSCF